MKISAGGVISDMMRMAQCLASARWPWPTPLRPQREFSRSIEEALAIGSSMLGYTTPQGDPILRSVLADLLADRGMRVTSDEFVITSGVTKGWPWWPKP